jgi:hypothetical protein
MEKYLTEFKHEIISPGLRVAYGTRTADRQASRNGSTTFITGRSAAAQHPSGNGHKQPLV